MKKYLINISNIRREYKNKQLKYSDLTKEPMELFTIWLNDVYRAKVPDATAMCIATVDSTGQPYQRLVLLKHFNTKEIIFYTNLKSRKSLQLNKNPLISVHFPWYFLNRQVMILGHINRLSTKEVSRYFYQRPRESQISAWASHQSQIIKSRYILEKKFLKFQKKFLNKKISLPYFWGGYKIIINTIEFWQGRRYRLHDRFIYTKNKKSWYINRLAP